MTSVEIFKSHSIKNLFILCLTILAGWLLAENQAFTEILTVSRESKVIGSFVGGLFYTSLFTTGPAAVMLGLIARNNSLPLVIFVGGAGAVIGDLILYLFLKDHLTDELFGLFGRVKNRRLLWFFHLRIVRWTLMILGAFIIALPLPDEIGLALLGLSRIKPKQLIPLSFALNSLGIALVGLIARAL